MRARSGGLAIGLLVALPTACGEGVAALPGGRQS